MRSFRSKPVGWRGHGAEHGLAARGYRVYASQRAATPVFYALQREEAVSTERLLDEVRSGLLFKDVVSRHPGADVEELRRRGISGIDGYEGDDSLRKLDEQGVDLSVELAGTFPSVRERYVAALADPQKASFLHPEKVRVLRERLGRL